MSGRAADGEPTGLGWPGQGAFDPDGPGPLPRPDGVDPSTQGVSRDTPLGSASGLGWAQPQEQEDR